VAEHPPSAAPPDAAYRHVRTGVPVSHTAWLTGALVVDLAADNRIIGVERIGGPVDEETLLTVLRQARVSGFEPVPTKEVDRA
jgi:hypothetical protein